MKNLSNYNVEELEVKQLNEITGGTFLDFWKGLIEGFKEIFFGTPKE